MMEPGALRQPPAIVSRVHTEVARYLLGEEGRKSVPLALFPPHCAWRRLILDGLGSVNRTWISALQCTGVAGLVTAVEAGLAVAVFAQSGLTEKMRTLGSTEGLPHIPDFEYVVRRSVRSSAAADRLRDIIVHYFRLEANLRGRKAHAAGPAISTRSAARRDDRRRAAGH
jgi:hypothetical protein